MHIVQEFCTEKNWLFIFYKKQYSKCKVMYICNVCIVDFLLKNKQITNYTINSFFLRGRKIFWYLGLFGKINFDSLEYLSFSTIMVDLSVCIAFFINFRHVLISVTFRYNWESPAIIVLSLAMVLRLIKFPLSHHPIT